MLNSSTAMADLRMDFEHLRALNNEFMLTGDDYYQNSAIKLIEQMVTTNVSTDLMQVLLLLLSNLLEGKSCWESILDHVLLYYWHWLMEIRDVRFARNHHSLILFSVSSCTIRCYSVFFLLSTLCCLTFDSSIIATLFLYVNTSLK